MMKESLKTKYSRSRLVGQLNVKRGLKPADLVEKSDYKGMWVRYTLRDEVFNELNSTYYTAHLMAITGIEPKGTCHLKDLEDVCRYDMILPKANAPLMLLDGKEYKCTVNRVSVWFFPCHLVLCSIEIDDSGNTLSDISKMHGRWKKWGSSYDGFCTDELDDFLNPLLMLTYDGNPLNLLFQGTKMRQYQVFQLDEEQRKAEMLQKFGIEFQPRIEDDLLYEMATHSPIDVVSDPDPCKSWKPSDDYFSAIIHENSVSAFSNWKALALNDTFTVMALDDVFVKSESDYQYFEMLYMRCLVQEYFCFSRNNAYRENPKMKIARVEREIDLMEKYYFYDDLSYDFLPPLMYKAMAKGLGLQGDREELVNHVKQALREKGRVNNDRIVAVVKIFAVLTTGWTLYSMITEIWPCIKCVYTAAIVSSLSVIVALALVFVTSKKRKK
jgi:hypothetical protein